MLKFYENENVIVNNEFNNKEYTYQVLDELSKEYDDLYLVIGADNIINFNKWKNVDRILSHHVIVVSRNDININDYLSEFDKSRFIVVYDNQINTSSTYLREKLINKDYDSVSNLLDKKILEYIKDHKLYLE